MLSTPELLPVIPAKNSQATRILVVDDDEMIHTLLTEVLREEGYDITNAANGRMTVELIISREFDLIVTDIVMPEMDGAELI